MIPVGQPYVPAGALDARSVLITTILGTTAAVIAAALVWVWEWSPIPTLLILTPLLQGLAVGAVMAFAIGRLRMRNPRLVAVVGFACGLLSVGLVHYGHYLHMVSSVASEVRSQVSQDKTIPDAQRQALLTQLDSDPGRFVDTMILERTNHAGFIGSLFLRNEQGVTLKSSVVRGTFLWILWAAEAFLAAIVAAITPRERASAPFCEDCGYWCEMQPDLLVLPGAAATPLVDAVRDNNPSRITALRESPPADDGSGLVGATLHACPSCDQSFADLSHRVAKGNQTKVTPLVKKHRVSPEVVEAIRSAPAPVVSESTTEEGTDANTSSAMSEESDEL